MNKIIRRKRRESKIVEVIKNHVNNNKKEYIITTILFFIGFILGIIFINNIQEEKLLEVTEHIKMLINNVKQVENINYLLILKESIISNIIIILILWIAASTIIGIPIVYAEVTFRGFVLGYTISSVLMALGTKYGIVYNLATLLLHNIIFIPVLFATTVSGIKTYKSIIKNKEKENVKLEFFRHTVFCLLMLLLFIVSSIIEVYFSTNLSKFIINYINI